MSGVIVSSQVSPSVSVLSDSICQVSSDSMSIIRYQISNVRNQVSSDGISSISVMYQVSGN